MKLRQSFLLLFAIANFAALPVTAKAQSLVDSSEIVASTAPQADLVYTRPTQEIKLRNYVFDAFGPYPIAGAAVVAGIGQIDNTPAAWGQGAGRLRQAVWLRPRHCGDQHHDALCISGSI